MRLMCLDVGRKRIGVAVSDLLMITAQGVKTIYRTSLEKDIEEYRKIIKEFDVDKIIIGLPKNMNSTVGEMAKEVQEYAKCIGKELNLPIEYYDERMTTKIASKILIEGNVSRKKRKNYVDMIAAVVILQDYMEKMKNE